jgi:hypothetical protein
MIDGGRASRLINEPLSLGKFFDRVTGFVLNKVEMKNEHNDRPEQIRKRKEKLKWLITMIPMGGAMAPETVEAKTK